MKKIVVFLLLVSNFFPSGCTRPKQYADYSRHSGFDRTEIDSATLRNLEVLGRVWGFVKYHHPAFSDDRYDLDFELFELLPLIADTAPAARNEILAQWIDGFGTVQNNAREIREDTGVGFGFRTPHRHRMDSGYGNARPRAFGASGPAAFCRPNRREPLRVANVLRNL